MTFVLNAVSISQELHKRLIEDQFALQEDLLELAQPTVVEAPTVPRVPVSPLPPLNVAVAVLLGIATGSILAFVLEALQAGNATESATATGLPVTTKTQSHQTPAGK